MKKKDVIVAQVKRMKIKLKKGIIDLTLSMKQKATVLKFPPSNGEGKKNEKEKKRKYVIVLMK